MFCFKIIKYFTSWEECGSKVKLVSVISQKLNHLIMLFVSFHLQFGESKKFFFLHFILNWMGLILMHVFVHYKLSNLWYIQCGILSDILISMKLVNVVFYIKLEVKLVRK